MFETQTVFDLLRTNQITDAAARAFSICCHEIYFKSSNDIVIQIVNLWAVLMLCLIEIYKRKNRNDCRYDFGDLR